MPRKNKEANAIDIIIGSMIKEKRMSKGMTRTELAKKIGVTHQQLEKYEKAINRISAGRLLAIAEALEVTVQSFFEGIEQHTPLPDVHSRLCIELSRVFMKIKNSQTQVALVQLARTFDCKA